MTGNTMGETTRRNLAGIVRGGSAGGMGGGGGAAGVRAGFNPGAYVGGYGGGLGGTWGKAATGRMGGAGGRCNNSTSFLHFMPFKPG